MRTISATLGDAQRAPNRRPYHKVVVSDRFCGIRRLRPTQWADTPDPAGPHGAAVPADASLCRVRVDLATKTLYYQRTATPGPSSSWAVWTSLKTNTRNCAIVANGTTVLVIRVDDVTPTQVKTNLSVDSGQTFAADVAAFTHTATITAIAAAIKSNGDIVLIVADSGNNVTAYKYTGTWAAGVATTDGTITPNGIAVDHDNDWNVIVTGVLAGTTAGVVAQRIFGDGFNAAVNTWTAPVTILSSSAGSGVSYSAPFHATPDVERLTFRESYSGTGAYNRMMHTYMPATADFIDALWRDPQPLNTVDSQYGISLAFAPTTVYLTSADLVYNWSLNTASLDVTADLVYAEHDEEPLATRLAVFDLDNSKAAYTPLPAAITFGAQVQVSPGYRNDTGAAETSDGPVYHIVAITHDPTAGILRLHAAPIWQVLEDWRPARTLQFSGVNVFNLLKRLAAAAGAIDLTGSGASGDSSSLTPATVIPAGANGLTAFRALLSRIPDAVYARAAALFLNNPLAADAADATYEWKAGGTNHPIEAARYTDRMIAHPHVRVIGGPTGAAVGDALDLAQAELTGAIPIFVQDRELTTGTLALNRANAITRGIQIDSRSDRIETPLNAAVETNDVLAITDTRIPLTAAKRRVLAIRTVRDVRRGRYHQTLTLGEA